MPQVFSVSAKRLKNLTISAIMALVTVIACLWPGAVLALATAEEQIARAIDNDMTRQIRQRHPELAEEYYQVEFQLRTVTETLTPCETPVHVDWRGQSLAGRQTARVYCQELGWQLYVPVTVSIRMPVVVSAGSLSRGHRLTEADMKLHSHDIGSLRMGYYDSESELVGYELARNLNPGDVITAYVATPPVMVERGDRVLIIATSGGLSVRTLGEALKQGHAGQQIPVRNLNSRKIIHAYIKEKGVVEIVN